MAIPKAPMQIISIDSARMPVDKDGYQYLLMIVDLFSKYITATALHDKTPKSFIGAFSKHWLSAHRKPYYLLSGQGSNVEERVLRSFCEVFGIGRCRSTPYNSQENGFAERNIRNVKSILQAVLLIRRLKQSNWRKLLPVLVFALNCSESKATKEIPGLWSMD